MSDEKRFLNIFHERKFQMQFENHELNMNQTIDPNRAILIQHCKSLFCTLFYGKQRNT